MKIISTFLVMYIICLGLCYKTDNIKSIDDVLRAMIVPFIFTTIMALGDLTDRKQ